MVGYLRPYVPELTIKDYNTYMQYMRGVRYQMYKDYGLLPSLLIRHDTVVLALLSDSLAGREATCRKIRGPLHLLRRKPAMCQTKGIRMAAQIEMVLAWRNLADMPREKMTPRLKFRWTWFQLLLSRSYKKAASNGPSIERLLAQERAQAEAQTIARAHSYEIASEPMANAMAAIFAVAAPDDINTKKLARYIGTCVGRIFYLLETANSVEEDSEKELYNVFSENGLTAAAAMENARRQSIAEVENLAHAYNILDVKLNRSLLDNILLIGLHHTVDVAGKKEPEKHWEIP